MPPGRSTRRQASKVCLRAERLDRDVDAAAVGQPHDLLDRIDRREVDDVVGAQPLRHLEPRRHAVDGDDRGRAA